MEMSSEVIFKTFRSVLAIWYVFGTILANFVSKIRIYINSKRSQKGHT